MLTLIYKKAESERELQNDVPLTPQNRSASFPRKSEQI